MVLRGAGSSSKLGRAANVMIARMVIAIARTSLKIDPSGVRAMSPSWRQIELGVLLSSRAIEREAVREITLWLNRENLSRSTKVPYGTSSTNSPYGIRSWKYLSTRVSPAGTLRPVDHDPVVAGRSILIRVPRDRPPKRPLAL